MESNETLNRAWSDFQKTREIKIGDEVTIFGANVAKVTKIFPFGTIEVESKGGKTALVSGLMF